MKQHKTKEFWHQKFGLVNRALKDNNESFYVGALTILMMMKHKGKNLTDYNKDCKSFKDFKDSTASRLSMSIYDEFDGEPYFSEILADWTREDYLRAVRIADQVKEMLLDANMDIIQYPNDFMSKNGKTFLDSFKSYTKVIQDKEEAEELVYSTVRINPKTRIYSQIETLKRIIEEERVELSSENIGVIELGKQTYNEQKDSVAKQNEIAQRNRMMQEKEDTIIIWN